MKTKLLFSAITLLAGSLFAADSSPKDDVSNAAKALAEKVNYSWHQSVTVPEGGRFRPGPTDGKTEKDGYTFVTMSFRDTTTEMVMKGDKAAINSPDNGWQSLAEVDADEGPGRFMAGMVRNFKAPAELATELAASAKEIKKDGDVYSSDLTEAGAKPLLSFGRRGGNGVEVSDAKGSVKFWITDGVLSKYETHVTGKVSFNGNDRDVDRTTTVEIKDVGTTKIEVPDGAKKKLNPEPPKTTV